MWSECRLMKFDQNVLLYYNIGYGGAKKVKIDWGDGTIVEYNRPVNPPPNCGSRKKGGGLTDDCYYSGMIYERAFSLAREEGLQIPSDNNWKTAVRKILGDKA